MPDRTLSERLRTAIERSNCSFKEFSERTRIPYRTLQNYLSGDRQPGADALAAIARMNVDVHWLLTGQEKHNVDHEVDEIENNNKEEYSTDEIFKTLAKYDLFSEVSRISEIKADKLNEIYVEKTGKSYKYIEIVRLIQLLVDHELSLIRRLIDFVKNDNVTFQNINLTLSDEIRLQMASDILNESLGGNLLNNTSDLLTDYQSGKL